MQSEETMQKYIDYLEYLSIRLTKYFEEQSPYIFCKKGCSKCCQKGDFPFKKIEFDYLWEGFTALSDDKKRKIIENVEQIQAEKQKYLQDNISKENELKTTFNYKCPFLIDDECSVYDHRGVICRIFGLISTREKGDSKVPFCAFEGLNYSNVVADDHKTISEEKFNKLNTKKEPLAYDIGYNNITGEKYESAFGFKFGELRPLIDWFE